jgi:hypothetical protein
VRRCRPVPVHFQNNDKTGDNIPDELIEAAFWSGYVYTILTGALRPQLQKFPPSLSTLCKTPSVL